MMWQSKHSASPDGWRYLWEIRIPNVATTPVRTLPGPAISSKINGKMGWDKLAIGMADAMVMDVEVTRQFCDSDLRAAIEGEGVGIFDVFGVTGGLFVCTTWILRTDAGNSALAWDDFDQVLFCGLQVFETGDSYRSDGVYKLTLVDALKVLMENIGVDEFARDFRTFTSYWGGASTWTYKVKERAYQVLFNSSGSTRHALVEWAGDDREIVFVRWVDVMQHMANYLTVALDFVTEMAAQVSFVTTMYDPGGEINASYPSPLRYLKFFKQNLAADAGKGAELAHDKLWIIGFIRDTSGGAPAVDYSDIVGGLLHTTMGWAAEYKSLWDLMCDLTGSGMMRGAIRYDWAAVVRGRIEWRGAWHGNTSAETMPATDSYGEWEVIRQPNTLGSAKGTIVTPRGQDMSGFEVKIAGRGENTASADTRFPLHSLPSADTPQNYIAVAEGATSLYPAIDKDITGTRAVIGRLDPTVESLYYEEPSTTNGGASWISADGASEVFARVHWRVEPADSGWTSHTSYIPAMPSLPYTEYSSSLLTLFVLWQIDLVRQQAESWPYIVAYYMAHAYSNRQQCDWEVTIRRPNPFTPYQILHTFPIKPSDLVAGIFPHLEAEAVILEAEWGDTEDKIRFSVKPASL